MAHRVFSQEEIEYIKNNYSTKTVYTLKKELGCSWEKVKGTLIKLGIEPPKSNNWTKEEEEQLRDLAKKYKAEKIAKLMNKTYTAIYIKARRLNITLLQKGGRKWTPEEEREFKGEWGNSPIEYLADKYRRTVNALKVKAQRMNLPPMIDNTEDLSISNVSKLINVSLDRIYSWKKKGLKIKITKVSKKCVYKHIALTDLLKFLKENQSEYDASKIEYLALGIEPNWLKSKRIQDSRSKIHVKEYTNRKYWTKEEERLLSELFRIGLSYEAIAQRLNRGVYGVKCKAIKLDLWRLKKDAWSGKDIKFLQDNYKNMTHEQMAKELNRTVKAVAAQCIKYGLRKKEIQ